MIKIENVEVFGFEAAIRGMRNPKNSWDKMDSVIPEVGPNDLDLMVRLANGGPVHAKYRRMIVVYLDITAPLYWWKEFDTYKIGTVSNSCSTMHKLPDKKFELDDFSHEHLDNDSLCILKMIIEHLNRCRTAYIDTEDKNHWWQMIQLLPSSYNQKRTIMLNYEVLVGMCRERKSHKLDEWKEFYKWILTLPLADDIIAVEKTYPIMR